MSIQLRPYQLDAIQQCRDRIEAGRTAPLLIAPTGAGKTAIASAIISGHLDIDVEHRVLVVAHRRELIVQMSQSIVRAGVSAIDVGAIMPGIVARPLARVQVASTQTLRARGKSPPATLLVFDEAHHYSSDDWGELAKMYPDVIRVGLTATPVRSDGRGMFPAFDSLVTVSTVKELTALGYLVPCKVMAPDGPLPSGSYTSEPVEAYVKHADGRKTVVFAATIAEAELFASQFTDRGIDAAVLHGSMSQSDRTKALRAHDRGAVLVNVMVLTEGWDSPSTSCCILARGCGSVGTYLQIVGRVLRPSPGKVDALLIDLTGRAYHAHGPPDADREYSLTGNGIRTGGKATDVYCKVCGQPAEPGELCAVCGYDPRPKDGPTEVTYTGDPLVEMYAAKRSEASAMRAETLARWFAEASAKWGPSKMWSALGKYKGVYGEPPTAAIKAAALASYGSVQCTPCTSCSKVVARNYGGLCGKCRFDKPKEV